MNFLNYIDNQFHPCDIPPHRIQEALKLPTGPERESELFKSGGEWTEGYGCYNQGFEAWKFPDCMWLVILDRDDDCTAVLISGDSDYLDYTSKHAVPIIMKICAYDRYLRWTEEAYEKAA
jgi:hypothetical protein